MDIKNVVTGGFLAGNRTYIVGAVAIITAVASYLTGDADLQATLGKVWELCVGLGLITLRAAK